MFPDGRAERTAQNAGFHQRRFCRRSKGFGAARRGRVFRHAPAWRAADAGAHADRRRSPAGAHTGGFSANQQAGRIRGGVSRGAGCGAAAVCAQRFIAGEKLNECIQKQFD